MIIADIFLCEYNVLTIWFPTTLEFCLSQRRVMWGLASSPPVLKEPPPEQLCTLVSTDQQQLLQKLRPISCAMYLFYDNHYFSWQVEMYFFPITTDFCRANRVCLKHFYLFKWLQNITKLWRVFFFFFRK